MRRVFKKKGKTPIIQFFGGLVIHPPIRNFCKIRLNARLLRKSRGALKYSFLGEYFPNIQMNRTRNYFTIRTVIKQEIKFKLTKNGPNAETFPFMYS
jgi:hypothetical protein